MHKKVSLIGVNGPDGELLLHAYCDEAQRQLVEPAVSFDEDPKWKRVPGGPRIKEAT